MNTYSATYTKGTVVYRQEVFTTTSYERAIDIAISKEESDHLVTVYQVTEADDY
jgi:hypothetical protein